MGRGGAGEVLLAEREGPGGQVRSGGNLPLFGVRLPGVVRAPGVRRRVIPSRATQQRCARLTVGQDWAASAPPNNDMQWTRAIALPSSSVVLALAADAERYVAHLNDR